MAAPISFPILTVIVYKGHEENPLLGPYGANIAKQIAMFELLNSYREREGRPRWTVTSVAGEKLVEELEKTDSKTTLLVIPAGQSSDLDRVFSAAQIAFIYGVFLKERRGRLYATCGASYMMSAVREYNGLCTQDPEKRQLYVKPSLLPLFDGVAKGPLCPYPGKQYKVGFYSDAVTVAAGSDECTIFLSGGGSFFPNATAQKVTVLVKYLSSELARLGKEADSENATILTPVGKGAALLSMFHPYYGSTDIDAEAYDRAFPDSGTNWKKVQESLSSLDTRMRFVLKAMLYPLEDFSR